MRAQTAGPASIGHGVAWLFVLRAVLGQNDGPRRIARGSALDANSTLSTSICTTTVEKLHIHKIENNSAHSLLVHVFKPWTRSDHAKH
jgi:hypothetical protein